MGVCLIGSLFLVFVVSIRFFFKTSSIVEDMLETDDCLLLDPVLVVELFLARLAALPFGISCQLVSMFSVEFCVDLFDSKSDLFV